MGRSISTSSAIWMMIQHKDAILLNTGIKIPTVEMRRSLTYDRIISTIKFPILVRQHTCILNQGTGLSLICIFA